MAFKILSHKKDEETNPGMIIITTDYTPCPVFVYPADKFNNVHDLKREIGKKIREFSRRKERRESRRDALEAELNG